MRPHYLALTGPTPTLSHTPGDRGLFALVFSLQLYQTYRFNRGCYPDKEPGQAQINIKSKSMTQLTLIK